jgi:hypothetical protein
VGLWAVVAVLSGCGDSVQQAAVEWVEPPRYTYVLESTCGERALIGRYRITVENGQVVKAEGLDEPARRTVADSPPDTIPTLAQLITELNEARRTRAGVADLETDPATGHPTRITIDPEPNAIDDESCYAISGVTMP